MKSKFGRIFQKVCFLACISFCVAYSANLQAQGSALANWGPSIEYDGGFNPSVAGWGSTVVEVHNGQSADGPMWYHVGQISGTKVTWGPSYNYDSGFNPSVAMYGTTVVEVHNGQSSDGPMWYHVGQVSGTQITWGPYYEYDSGWNPKVALYGSTVVEVHNGQAADGPMWYHVGQVSGTKITWGPSYNYDGGFNPSVAMYGTTVVEVHNGQATDGPMWYHVGQVSSATKITWGPSYNYDGGWNPKVAFSGGLVVEVHNGQAADGPMWYHMGWVGSSTINWGPSYNYDGGFNPSVAWAVPLDSGLGTLVEVHNGQSTDGPMWYHVGSPSVTPAGTLIDFDTTPSGAAIANSSVLNNTYSSLGVTFQSEPCPSGTPQCQVIAAGDAYAVATSASLSQPNVINTLTSAQDPSGLLEEQWGGIQANFNPPVTSASIWVLETCVVECLGTPPRAFLAAYNSSGDQITYQYASGPIGVAWQMLTVNASPGGDPIAFVQFTDPYGGVGNEYGAWFDDLTFTP